MISLPLALQKKEIILMKKLTGKRLGYLLMFVYMVSYLTRINYGAVIIEMVADTGHSKALLSMALTFSFITYGAGQLLSGFLGDRMQPKALILIGLSVSACMNLSVTFFSNPWAMAAVWAVNGLAQAFMWPPITKLMVSLMTADEYKQATVTVAMGSSAGTILIYLLAPVLISVGGWRSVFYFSALCGIVMLVFLSRCPIGISLGEPMKKQQEKGSGSWFSPMLVAIMAAIVLQGMLRDGVTTWMPSYISETYSLGNSISILTGVALPIFSIACFKISERLYRKKLQNPLLCGGAIFGVGALSALLLMLLTGRNALGSVFFTALLTGCMHGVNLMLICMVPPFYKETGKVSLVSGTINACTYVGSAISTYGIALLTEKCGWNATVLVWFLIAAAGTAICFLCIPAWKKRFGKEA